MVAGQPAEIIVANGPPGRDGWSPAGQTPCPLPRGTHKEGTLPCGPHHDVTRGQPWTLTSTRPPPRPLLVNLLLVAKIEADTWKGGEALASSSGLLRPAAFPILGKGPAWARPLSLPATSQWADGRDRVSL